MQYYIFKQRLSDYIYQIVNRMKMIKDIEYNATEQTPRITYNSVTGALLIEGNSIDINKSELYDTIINNIDTGKYASTVGIKCKIKMNIINGMAMKQMYKLLRKVECTGDDNSKPTVDWYYYEDDPQMKEIVEEISDLFDMPFNIIRTLN